MKDNWNPNVYLNFCLLAYFILGLGNFLIGILICNQRRRNEELLKYFYKNLSKSCLQNIHIHHRQINKFVKCCAHLRFILKRVTIFIG